MQNDSNELAEILSFAAGRARSGQITLEEVKSWVDVILSRSTIWATAEELADFYGQSEHNVRSIINRRYLGKPKRRVYYSFNAFRKIVPKTWVCHMKAADCQAEK